MDGFNEQLRAVKKEAKGSVQEFPDWEDEDVCQALGIAVKFIKPAQSSAMRATFSKINSLAERVEAIGDELKTMGAVWDCDGYKPDPNKFLDKSLLVTSLPGMKRAREAGQSLDRNAYGALKHRKPIDTAKFQAQVKKLHDEECDCLIALREFQVNGVEFDF